MEKEKEAFFHSIYLKWIEHSIRPHKNAINVDICSAYCEFLKDYIDFNDIENYCKTVGENEYTINELKNIWKNVGNAFDISLSVLIPAKYETEALDKICNILKENEVQFKIDKCNLVNHKKKGALIMKIHAKGTLVIIGGAEEREGKREILSKLLTYSPKKAITVGLVSSATEFPNDSEDSYRKAFLELGAKDFVHFDIRSHSEADTETNLKRVEETDIVFFSGGDQYRLVHILAETKFIKRIYERYHTDSIVVAGTSAGAACLSNPMIYDGDAETGFLKGTVKITAGFGFINECVIDTHFVTRLRFGRLIQTVALNPSLIGIGVDEDTALIVRKGIPAEIIGSGSVVIVDSSDSKYIGISKVGFKEPFTISPVKMHILTNGADFNLEKKIMSQSISNTVFKI